MTATIRPTTKLKANLLRPTLSSASGLSQLPSSQSPRPAKRRASSFLLAGGLTPFEEVTPHGVIILPSLATLATDVVEVVRVPRR